MDLPPPLFFSGFLVFKVLEALTIVSLVIDVGVT